VRGRPSSERPLRQKALGYQAGPTTLGPARAGPARRRAEGGAGSARADGARPCVNTELGSGPPQRPAVTDAGRSRSSRRASGRLRRPLRTCVWPLWTSAATTIALESRLRPTDPNETGWARRRTNFSRARFTVLKSCRAVHELEPANAMYTDPNGAGNSTSQTLGDQAPTITDGPLTLTCG